MPTYQYRCNGCDGFFEVVQSFTDDALTTCSECGGVLRKVFSGVGVVFKGSGFYRNDSRTGSSSSSGSTASGGGSSAPSTTSSPSNTPGGDSTGSSPASSGTSGSAPAGGTSSS